MTIESQSKFRWEEMEEDDDLDLLLDFLLPPKQVIGPDENGFQTVIEYKFNDEGNKGKITTRSKFGDAANEESGSHLTMVSTEEILMERPRLPGTKADESKAALDSLFPVVCRICHTKGDHWKLKCPRKAIVYKGKPRTGETSTNTAAPGGTGRATPRPT